MSNKALLPNSSGPISSGKVYLIGAGPGDPELITLRGVQCLRKADVVLYDYLANPLLLRYLKKDVEKHCMGRHGQGKLWSQEDINSTLVKQAQSGKIVVRLKSGDPTVFARAADEIEPLLENNIPFEIVPGITTALAASSCAGIPVTHSGLSSAVALITGHEKPGKDEQAVNYKALADFPGTLVIYMGVTTAPKWAASLIEHGKDPTTPVAIIRRCSWPDQSSLLCELQDIPKHLHKGSKIRPPVIVVIGEVASLGPRYAWFEQRPLFGQQILITRPEHQADQLRMPLAELGADVYVQPSIEIAPPKNWDAVDDAINRMREFDWIVFSSTNGVRSLMDRVLELGRDLRIFGNTKIAAIGSGTAAQLSEYHLTADCVPEEYRAEALVASLQSEASGKKFLLPRASRGRDVLPNGLTAAGGTVEQVIVYQSTDRETCTEEVEQFLDHNTFNWVITSSSAIARATVNLLGDQLKESKIASISPITSQTLRELGYEPSAEATEYTMDGIVAAILEAEAK
ncbi:MAG: uroporphyrinogen-III C-methyltransferase [Blastopirellula sp.]|nr:MAG: uroporphyrinogen-III C-methyltransferase [Blastopirellula sp.]